VALATNPTLLLLDEPTAGMTPGETREATSLIRKVVLERSLTLLLIEHDMSVVMGISDRVAVLHFGEKIAEGTPAAIRSDARVIEAYPGGGDDLRVAHPRRARGLRRHADFVRRLAERAPGRSGGASRQERHGQDHAHEDGHRLPQAVARRHRVRRPRRDAPG